VKVRRNTQQEHQNLELKVFVFSPSEMDNMEYNMTNLEINNANSDNKKTSNRRSREDLLEVLKQNPSFCMPIVYENVAHLILPPLLRHNFKQVLEFQHSRDEAMIKEGNIQPASGRQIIELLEYFVGGENMKYTFGRGNVDSEGWVKIECVLLFKRFRMVSNTESIVRAVEDQESEIEINEDRTRVRHPRFGNPWANHSIHDE
jgi:hypothetical protein